MQLNSRNELLILVSDSLCSPNLNKSFMNDTLLVKRDNGKYLKHVLMAFNVRVHSWFGTPPKGIQVFWKSILYCHKVGWQYTALNQRQIIRGNPSWKRHNTPKKTPCLMYNNSWKSLYYPWLSHHPVSWGPIMKKAPTPFGQLSTAFLSPVTQCSAGSSATSSTSCCEMDIQTYGNIV